MIRAVSFILLVIFTNFQGDKMQEARLQMVEKQIMARGISDKATIEAMKKVPRHNFVPKALESYAYNDHPLSIGYNQTISQPYIVAFMTEALKLQKTDKVLEIGTGSGYQAAILGEIVSEVYTIEIVAPLAEEARRRLKDLGYTNITVITGDGYKGYKDRAPYQAIIVTAAPKIIPPALMEQLDENGRMIIPVGPSDYTQYLTLVEKKNGKTKQSRILPVRFVPFTGEAQE